MTRPRLFIDGNCRLPARRLAGVLALLMAMFALGAGIAIAGDWLADAGAKRPAVGQGRTAELVAEADLALARQGDPAAAAGRCPRLSMSDALRERTAWWRREDEEPAAALLPARLARLEAVLARRRCVPLVFAVLAASGDVVQQVSAIEDADDRRLLPAPARADAVARLTRISRPPLDVMAIALAEHDDTLARLAVALRAPLLHDVAIAEADAASRAYDETRARCEGQGLVRCAVELDRAPHARQQAAMVRGYLDGHALVDELRARLAAPR